MGIEKSINMASSDLSNLDSIGVLDQQNFPSLRLGHYIDLGIFGPESNEKSEALAYIANSYRKTFCSKITHYHPHDSSQIKTIDNIDFEAYLMDRLHQPYDTETHEGFSVTLYGFESGEDDDEPTLFFFNATAATQRHHFSTISAYLPASWPESHGYDTYIELVRGWCEALKPNHGTAGLSILYNEGQQTHEDRLAAFPIIKRFVGLDIPESSRWYTMMGRQNSRGIRTINWLTIVDDKYISQLNNAYGTQIKTGEHVIMHDYQGGSIIQAGSRPEIGDINQGLIPHLYRAVAKLLSPIIFQAYPCPLIDAPSPLDSLSETLAWVRRFD